MIFVLMVMKIVQRYLYTIICDVRFNKLVVVQKWSSWLLVLVVQDFMVIEHVSFRFLIHTCSWFCMGFLVLGCWPCRN